MKTRLDWAVCDMDDGVLRWETTRGKAVQWLLGFGCTDKVLRRHQFGPGAYEYAVGHQGDSTSAFIVSRDRLAHHGWNPDQPALHPDRDRPFHRVDRPEESSC